MLVLLFLLLLLFYYKNICYYMKVTSLCGSENYIYKPKRLPFMWPFNNPRTFDQHWQEDMLKRWTDIEARLTKLELNDGEYKKRNRRRIQEPEELNNQEGGLLRHGNIQQD